MRISKQSPQWFLMSLVVLIFNACANAPVIQGSLPEVPEKARVTLSPGDEIELKFHYWPELNETQIVRPDGKISLQLIDDVEAAGLTPDELDVTLTSLYETKIKDPVITVIVRSLSNQFVYVGGEVEEPGKIPIEGQIDLVQAIVQAGGLINLSANPSNIIIYRNMENKRYASSFDFEQIISSPEQQQIVLAPNDIVYVTRSGIDEANQWVLQHLENMIPRSITVPASVLIGDFAD